MRKPQSPCEGCTNRSPECHADCKFYEWYQSENEMYKEQIKQNRSEEDENAAYSIGKFTRIVKKLKE